MTYGRLLSAADRYSSQVKKYANRTSDRIVGPLLNPGSTVPMGKYKLLDKDGIANVGEVIQPGDIYINRQSPINTRDPIANPGVPLMREPHPLI